MRFRNNTTVSGIGSSTLLLLVLTSLLTTACATGPGSTPLPLHQFINDLRTELIRTDSITRLTVTQVAVGQGDRLLKEEQDAQCSSDPILMFLGDEIVFKLKATVGSEVGTPLVPVPAPTIKITGSGDHQLDWKVSPISLGNLANVVFEGDIKTAQSISSGNNTQTEEITKIKKALFDEAWKLRSDLITVTDNLIKNWQKPKSCQ